jgi:hypothetical protein
MHTSETDRFTFTPLWLDLPRTALKTTLKPLDRYLILPESENLPEGDSQSIIATDFFSS